jgi:hypothetical protein
MEKEQIFGKLSEFEGRSVTLFRSSDQHNTSVYFTNDENKRTSKSFFEILHFQYDFRYNELFIRFPNTDHFIELRGGSSSSRGNMNNGIAENVWEDHKRLISIFEHDGDMFIRFGEYGDFNFLKIVGRYCNTDDIFKYNESSYDSNLNLNEIENALKKDYLKLPMNVREISYMSKTTDFIPTYYIVDYPKYNFSYNQRLRKIENNVIKEYNIDSFQRYKDGGTTRIKFSDENNIEHVLFYPTRLGKKEDVDLIDDKQLVAVTDDEKVKICELLEILLEK